MKRSLVGWWVWWLLLAGAAVAAEPFDARSLSFEDLFRQLERPGDSPEQLNRRAAAMVEWRARGANTLSNLMDRIHIENVGLGVRAMNLVKDDPLPAEQAVPVLVSFLSHPRPVTRKMAVYFLGFYSAPAYAEQVYPLLDHEKTRGAAIRTLGKWHVTNAVPRLMPYLQHPQERVRIVTVNALRDIGAAESIQPLIAALSDSVFTVRNAAAWAVLRYGRSAYAPLVDALRRAPPGEGRRQLIRCLGDLRDDRALRHLRPLLQDPDYDTRRDVVRSIEEINGLRADAWFAPSSD